MLRKRAVGIACIAALTLIILLSMAKGLSMDAILNGIPKICPADGIYGLV